MRWPRPRRLGDADRSAERELMVERQLRDRGIRSERVLDAFRAVPRERFVPEALRGAAYEDRPLGIGEGQTISQPWVVGVMVQALDLRPTDRVLEVGAGSGYAAAILARLGGPVHAIERHAPLAATARERLAELGIDSVTVLAGDGTRGWPGGGSFDAILVSAGGTEVPSALLDQLAPGGRMVIPVGGPESQDLVRLVKADDGTVTRDVLAQVRFVPLLADPPGP